MHVPGILGVFTVSYGEISVEWPNRYSHGRTQAGSLSQIVASVCLNVWRFIWPITGLMASFAFGFSFSFTFRIKFTLSRFQIDVDGPNVIHMAKHWKKVALTTTKIHHIRAWSISAVIVLLHRQIGVDGRSSDFPDTS